MTTKTCSYKVQPMISVYSIDHNQNIMACQNDWVKYQCMVSIAVEVVHEEEIMREIRLALNEGVDRWQPTFQAKEKTSLYLL